MERRKEKELVTREEMKKKKVKIAADVLAARERINKIIQAHHEMEPFTVKVDQDDKNAFKYFIIMQK